MGALKSMREAAGLTVLDMARDVSVSEETYMRWEQGDIQNISPMQAIRLAYVSVLQTGTCFLAGWRTRRSETNGGLARWLRGRH